MTIEALVALIPPPAEPDYAFEGPWEPLEARLGSALPQDYKDFVRVYGSGRLFDALWIHVPTCESPYVRLGPQLNGIRHELKGQEDGCPYPLWPAPGGWIACGSTDYGDKIFWLPEGAPEHWQIMAWWRRPFPEFEVFDLSLTGFLAGLATGEVEATRFRLNLGNPSRRTFVQSSFWPKREDQRWEWRPAQDSDGS